jgi:biopolymer transport protein ExbD
MLNHKIFFNKKDAINITPFLDIMLILFIVIIVVSSFSFKKNEINNEQLLKQISILKKKIIVLKQKNNLLKNENLVLKQQVSLNKNSLKEIKDLIDYCTFNISVFENYVKIDNKTYSIKKFFNLIKKGFIKKVNFSVKKTDAAKHTYIKIKNNLKKLGWEFND